MDSIDKLLAQIKAEYQESDEPEQPKKQPPSKKKASLESLLSQLESKAEPINKQQLSSEAFNQPRSKNAASLDSLLYALKVDYKAQDRAEEQLRQEQLEAEELRKQQLKQEELESLKQQVIAWLKELDPLSTEGLWFEKFAEKYSSKLEAALDYLQEIKENNLKSD